MFWETFASKEARNIQERNIINAAHYRKLNQPNAFGDWAVSAYFLKEKYGIALQVLTTSFKIKHDAIYLFEEDNRKNIEVK